ncbi:MAG: L,D-transpeptidase family protein [Actinomycetota bacterium]
MKPRRHLRLALLAAVLGVTGLIAPVAGAADGSFELDRVNGFGNLVRLSPDSTGVDVVRLQVALTQLGFYHSRVNGTYDQQTESAVLALHKYLGLERTTTFNALDWIRLQMLADPVVPNRWDEPDRVEVDLARQIMFVIRNGSITGILPVSTGGGYSYVSVRQGRIVGANTPEGDFHLAWRQFGWHCDSVTTWCVYNYWEFSPMYGIHGYHSVPEYPASHGCTRVNIWDSDWLDSQLFIGIPVHIWSSPPVVSPPPPPPAHRAA